MVVMVVLSVLVVVCVTVVMSVICNSGSVGEVGKGFEVLVRGDRGEFTCFLLLFLGNYVE